MVCGEVNSKNSNGEYVGFQKFIVNGGDDSLVLLQERFKPGWFQFVWSSVCTAGQEV